MNLTNVMAAILAAIMALALIIPGLDALKASVEGLQQARINEAKEACLAIVERRKIVASQVSSAQQQCVSEATVAINDKFATAIEMIDSFRAALVLQQQSAASAASASSGSSSTP